MVYMFYNIKIFLNTLFFTENRLVLLTVHCKNATFSLLSQARERYALDNLFLFCLVMQPESSTFVDVIRYIQTKIMLSELLRSPYPMLYKRWKSVVFPSVIIFLLLYTFEPFGISRIESNRWVVSVVSALITAAAMSLSAYGLPAMFPFYHDESRWTVGKHLLNLFLMFLLIAAGVWAYEAWMMEAWTSAWLFVKALLWVMLLAPFPTVLFMMWNRNLVLDKNLKEAMKINESLANKIADADNPTPKKDSEGESPEPLVFSGGTKEVLQVAVDDFCYAEASGNYVSVTYYSAEEKKYARKLMRGTMKETEKAVAASPCIVRCHRAFVVNVRKVVKVSGNSQGYRLQLKGLEEQIPVSRAYSKAVKKMLERKE